MSGGNRPYDVLMSTLGDVEERTSADLVCGERTPAPWESAMQATCECLSSGGTLDNLERRQAEDRLGESVYARFPVHTRSALIVAHSLMDRDVITEEELRAKMKEVRARLEMV
ncbi:MULTISPECIES: nitrile hydratase subunit beta [Microtetraspora]|uniref:Nitrile hydratase subunit beta n=1 Tax=Microtetraspora glauca TaxID=1996 RepID=A0ABV3GQ30_MICGL|nr:nitrile hydratase subunit beta [Microtetraspora sp. AC03309]MCC5580509.1 nitrile hydratase subunit beta [Microtetraspora sp. AC03309]